MITHWQELQEKLNLSRVAITATIDRNGRLGHVSGAFEKLLALCFASPQTGRPHTLLVAKDQPGIDVETINREYEDFRVIEAETMEEALGKLIVRLENRRRKINKNIVDTSRELQSHKNFVGRERLFDEVSIFLGSIESGYLLIKASPGVGKSAFIAQLIQSNKNSGLFYHFIKQNQGEWDNPEFILRSLILRLSDYYLIAISEDQLHENKLRQTFVDILNEVSRFIKQEEQVIIYIDGLDEAFGPTGRFCQVALSGIFPQYLPEKIKIVLSSRPGKFLNWLANPRLCQVIELDEQREDNKADIYKYIQQQNEVRQLGISEELCRKLVTASENCFTVAERYLHERTGLEEELRAWQQNSNAIPQGLNGWLQEQWLRLQQNEELFPVAKIVLGIMTAAYQPLSKATIREFLDVMIAQSNDRFPKFLNHQNLEDLVDKILMFTQEFFIEQLPKRTLHFFHTSFQEFAKQQLNDQNQYKKYHSFLAIACLGYKDYEDEMDRDYCLQYRMKHLIEAREWEKFLGCCGEVNFFLERCLSKKISESPRCRYQFNEFYRDVRDATRIVIPKYKDVFSSYERFLRFRLGYLDYFPQMYRQELLNEFISSNSHFQRIWQLEWKDGDWCKVKGSSTISPNWHTGTVTSIAFSPDSKRIASASHDGTVKIWDSDSGDLLVDFLHTGDIRSVAFSPDGKRIVSADFYMVKVWDSYSGELLDFLHTDNIRSVAFSLDGKRIVSAAFVFEEKERIPGSLKSFLDLAYSRSKLLVKVWDSDSGDLLTNFSSSHTGSRLNMIGVNCVAFSPDGKRIAVTWDKTVKIWDSYSGELLTNFYGDVVGRLVFSPDGKRIASASYYGTLINVWDSGSGELLVGFFLGARYVNLVFSPDGKRIVVANQKSLKVLDSYSGNLLVNFLHTDYIKCVALSPDGKRIASGNKDGTVKMRDSYSGNLLGHLSYHTDIVLIVAFSPDGKRIAFGREDGTVKVLDSYSGDLLVDFLHTDYIQSIAFSPDGKRIASADRKSLKVWDSYSGDLLVDFLHTGYIQSVAFSPDGKRIAVADLKSLKVLDSYSGDLLVDFLYTGYIQSVAFSPDGKRIAVARVACWGKIEIWDSYSGELLVDFYVEDVSVKYITFYPDGKRIASGSDDGTIKIWNSYSGKLLVNFSLHTNSIRSVAFSPDGKRIVSASDDRTVKVWDSYSGECLTSFTFSNIPMKATFLQNENTCIIVDRIGQVFIYKQ